jgi:hypothetical protein
VAAPLGGFVVVVEAFWVTAPSSPGLAIRIDTLMLVEAAVAVEDVGVGVAALGVTAGGAARGVVTVCVVTVGVVTVGVVTVGVVTDGVGGVVAGGVTVGGVGGAGAVGWTTVVGVVGGLSACARSGNASAASITVATASVAIQRAECFVGPPP